MENLREKWLRMSWIVKFFWIISTHLFINIITSVIFFLDDYSLINQIIHSVIHLSFFVLLIKVIYIPKKENRLRKKNEKWWVWGFVILNLIPFFQGLAPADNGFVPMWAIAPQVNFGLPITYMHYFTTEFQNVQGNVNNPLVHINILFFNLYFWVVFTIVTLAIMDKIKKRKRPDNNRYQS